MDITNADHDQLIRRFYAAFDARDGATMAAAYAPDVHFSDPVFQDLHGPEAGAMWIMLTGRAKDLSVKLVSHEAHEHRGSAHWTADYTFAQTGRRVHNDVHAEFTFVGGLIHTHHDRFSFHGWTRQALGPVGLLLGWTPLIQGKVRRQARAGLDAAMASV
ncbi:MAG: nuclear transport factor 2 family protein [Conexibacter sp.]|nr:nuclear transport factor 2 family protein [Conexibacter sp.]